MTLACFCENHPLLTAFSPLTDSPNVNGSLPCLEPLL